MTLPVRSDRPCTSTPSLNDLVDSSDSLDDDRVLIGGREHRPVVITAYDPAWPRRYGQEQRRIAEALGSRALRIDHIGSTSVPGLAAKPIVDVLVAVDGVLDEGITSLVELVGYVLRVREPGHRMVRTPERDVHVHLWRAESDDVRRHLLFRDWLRVDPLGSCAVRASETPARRPRLARHERLCSSEDGGDRGRDPTGRDVGREDRLGALRCHRPAGAAFAARVLAPCSGTDGVGGRGTPALPGVPRRPLLASGRGCALS
jgi:GrpB-like predicted nucleotidyltransferase (UPF0157 family)